MTNLLIRLFVKNNQNKKDNSVREGYGRLGGMVGIFCNLFLFALKLTAGLLSGSVSIMADAFNNLSDMGSSIITLLGFKISCKPADPEHPFGHGRMEYMSAAVVSVLIVLVGAELLKTSVKKIFSPEPLSLSALTFVVLIISIGIKLWMSLFNKKLGVMINSSALKATSLDSLTDCVATGAVLLSLVICAVFKINIDPYVGVLVAVFILFSGIKALAETLNPLLGMPPEDETLENIKDMVLSFDGFLGIHDLIVHNYGPGRMFASLHVEVPCTADILKCHEQIDYCEKKIKEEMHIEAIIHMDPIVTDDDFVISIKNQMLDKIKTFDSGFSAHDFRIVKGEKRTNLIFDVVTPPKYPLSEEQIKEKIGALAREIDPTFVCVMTIDVDYTHSAHKRREI
ncbi:MAG: cation diffusion facilitator family transporter [Oscillospiraceae bacterium]